MRRHNQLTLAAVIISIVTTLGASQDRPRTVGSTPPQTQDDVVRVNTRVVFVDTLVKDKRTGQPVDNLKRDDFQVLDNGRARELTYFSLESAADKRPLALLLVLAPLDYGDRDALQKPDVINSLSNALAKLPVDDEVAVLFVWRSGLPHMISNLTRDRQKTVAAFRSLPQKQERDTQNNFTPIRLIQNAAGDIAKQRPASQVRIVVVTDSVFLIRDDAREDLIRNLLLANVTFNALITGDNWFFTAWRPLLKPLEEGSGAGSYDVPQYIARETGGDYVRARRKKDYGPALEKLIGGFAARYSLGFTIGEDEIRDNQLHRLEVRVKPRDAQGKERKLEVSARRGYYLRAK